MNLNQGRSALLLEALGAQLLLCPQPAFLFELLGFIWVRLGCPKMLGFLGQCLCTELHLELGGRMAVELQRALPFLEVSSCPAGKPQQIYLGLPSTM